MTPEQRSAIRETAKYLRRVRPIDPDEIHEYVEGRPHPSAIRQVLRESATDLGLVEHEDDTFTPVSEAPVPTDGTPERFPPEYGQLLLDQLVDQYGVDWSTGESGDRLRTVIRQLKTDYFRGRAVTYDAEAALGYAIYHLPDAYAAMRYVVDEVARNGLLGHRLRVLDVGAGVGGPALGLFEFLPDDALVEYHAVEPSAAVDLLETFLETTGRNVHPTIHREAAETH